MKNLELKEFTETTVIVKKDFNALPIIGGLDTLFIKGDTLDLLDIGSTWVTFTPKDKSNDEYRIKKTDLKGKVLIKK